MILDKKVCAGREFSKEYFKKGGHIKFNCPHCATKNVYSITPYVSGEYVPKLEEPLIEQLIDNYIVKKEPNANNHPRYKISRWSALYEFIICTDCKEKMMAIFGMGERHAYATYIQFKGIWNFKDI